MRYDLKPRSTLELVDGSFKLVRDNLAGFIAIEAPLVLLQAAHEVFLESSHHPRAFEAIPVTPSNVIALLLMILFTLADRVLLPAATVAAFEGQVVSLRDCFRRAGLLRRQLLALFAVCSLPILITGTPLIQDKGLRTLLLIPSGVSAILFLRWSFCYAVVFAEATGTGEALRRAWSLLQGALARLLVPSGLALMIWLTTWMSLRHILARSPIAGAFGSAATFAVFSPFATSFVTLLYFDQRIRRGEFDPKPAA